ncbi:MAG: 2-oxoacid:acceptor oxidoreductase family protein [Nitrospiraceae bacterium]
MVAVRFMGEGCRAPRPPAGFSTAAFLSGFQAQDAPIYGAERRGAPVAAFTRIARRPIRERGVIAHPDLVVVADASLISDPTAHVMDGIRSDTAVFVNSPLSKSQVWEGGSFPGPIMMLDLPGVALERLGNARPSARCWARWRPGWSARSAARGDRTGTD